MADLTTQPADQPDWHWRSQLRPRLDGLTDLYVHHQTVN